MKRCLDDGLRCLAKPPYTIDLWLLHHVKNCDTLLGFNREGVPTGRNTKVARGLQGPQSQALPLPEEESEISNHWLPLTWIPWKIWRQLPKPASTLELPSQAITESMRARSVPPALDYPNATDIQLLHQPARAAAKMSDIATIRELEVGIEFFTDIPHDQIVVDIHRN